MTARKRRAPTAVAPLAPPPPLARVEILWSENGAVPTRVFRSLADADAALARAFAEQPAPRGGGYDKTAFLVVWTDGKRHEGRADVTDADVRRAPRVGGILRLHLIRVSRWMCNTLPAWITGADREAKMAWGYELHQRLAAEPPLTAIAADTRAGGTDADDTDDDEPNDDEPGDDEEALAPRNADGQRYRGATLLPWPPTRADWLMERFRRRPRSNPVDRDSHPLTTNKDIRWAVNYVSRALVHDVPTFPEHAHARLWDHWRALHESIELLLRKGGTDDEYADNEGFWRTQLSSLVSLMTSSWGPPRNRAARLTYRPVGATGDPYPAWVQDLRGRSGVYVIRERQDDGTTPIVYVGQSSLDRLYETLTRHFQTWRRWKGFWRGQYAEGHDPGLTYDRAACAATAIVTAPDAALELEARLIARLHPRDNLLGQPAVEDAPF